MTKNFPDISAIDFLIFMDDPDHRGHIHQEYNAVIELTRRNSEEPDNEAGQGGCLPLVHQFLRSFKTAERYQGASFIDGPQKYICVSNPEKEDCEKFLELAWRREVATIVKTSRRAEEESYQYWSSTEGSEIEHGGFRIKTLKISERPRFTLTVLRLSDRADRERQIRHYQYTAGRNTDEDDPLVFLSFVCSLNDAYSISRRNQPVNTKPGAVLVHCSDGLSCSAVYCILDICVTQFKCTDIMSSLKDLSYAAMENDGMIRAWLGHILYFIAVDPMDLEVVLKTCLEKDDLHRFLRTIIGYGGIFAPVPIWRPRRKILLPAFSPKIVESFVPVFAEQSMKLANKVGEKAGGDKFSLWPFISSYTLDSVCETAFGVKLNAQEDNNAPFLVELNKVLELVCKRIFHLWLQPDWLYKFFPDHFHQENGLKILHGFTNDVITKKRVELKTELVKSPEADREFDFSNYTNKTFLDLLIRLSGGEKGYNDLELREEILTLTIAATNTSATAVGYALKMLAKYPDVQEKVIQELDEVFGDSDRLFEKEDLARLNYLERVIKETLRLFPPVPFIIRKVEEETALPSGRVLPAGSGVVVSIWGTHRNSKYWGPDAEKFDPDRFLPERFNLKHPCAFLPFSNGPRNCIRDIMMKAVDGYEIALQRRRPLVQI